MDKSKSQILSEVFKKHDTTILNREIVYEAMEAFAESKEKELKAAETVIGLIISAESGDELIGLRDALRKEIT